LGEGTGQPGTQPVLARHDLIERDAFVVSVGGQRVAGAVVDRGDPERRETGDVGPTVLRQGLSPDGAGEFLGERSVESRPGAVSGVSHLNLETTEEVSQVLDGLGSRA